MLQDLYHYYYCKEKGNQQKFFDDISDDSWNDIKSDVATKASEARVKLLDEGGARPVQFCSVEHMKKLYGFELNERFLNGEQPLYALEWKGALEMLNTKKQAIWVVDDEKDCHEGNALSAKLRTTIGEKAAICVIRQLNTDCTESGAGWALLIRDNSDQWVDIFADKATCLQLAMQFSNIIVYSDTITYDSELIHQAIGGFPTCGLLAIPGPSKSATNQLIKQGWTLADQVSDIVHALEMCPAKGGE